MARDPPGIARQELGGKNAALTLLCVMPPELDPMRFSVVLAAGLSSQHHIFEWFLRRCRSEIVATAESGVSRNLGEQENMADDAN